MATAYPSFATANCHLTGPATLLVLSATVTAIACTSASRFPGAWGRDCP
jgi:hypothetical protein